LIAQHLRIPTLERLWREHQERRHNHSHLFWTLLNLALWERQFLRGQDLAGAGGATASLDTVSPPQPPRLLQAVS